MALPRWFSRYLGLATEVIAPVDAAQLFVRHGDERLLLHIGCGPAGLPNLPTGFQQGFREIRVDLDTDARPDLIASFSDLSCIPDASVDAIFTSHTIEHLYWFEVASALAECRRVLQPDGFLALTLPDAQEIARWVAEDRLLDVAYVSPAGPITPMDMLWGHLAAIEKGKSFMQHKCGFTLRTLNEAVRAAGFAATFVIRRPDAFDLWLLACPLPTAEATLKDLASRYLVAHDM